MNDPRLTPRADLPGEMNDPEERDRALAELGLTEEDMANPEYNLMLNEDGTPYEPEPGPNEPPAGSWAAVARLMAEDDDSDFDWDAWKDQMKEGDY